MAYEPRKTVSVELDPTTAEKLAQLFQNGLDGVAKVADACNNIDRQGVKALADACNNIDASGLKAVADACNNIDGRGVKALADACNNIDARGLKTLADACNNVDARRLAETLKPLDQNLGDLAARLATAARGE